MFSRVDELFADLRAFAAGTASVDGNWKAPDDRFGAALIRIALGKMPAELRAANRETVDAVMRNAAQRFIAEHFFGVDADYYRLLGVRRETPPEQLRKNYQRLIALVHPDSFPIGFPKDAATQVNRAYTTLSDPEARLRYELLHGNRESVADSVGASTIIVGTRSKSERASKVVVGQSWLAHLRASVPRPQFRSGLIFLCAALIGTASLGIYTLLTTESYPALVESRARASPPDSLASTSADNQAATSTPLPSVEKPLPTPQREAAAGTSVTNQLPPSSPHNKKLAAEYGEHSKMAQDKSNVIKNRALGSIANSHSSTDQQLHAMSLSARTNEPGDLQNVAPPASAEPQKIAPPAPPNAAAANATPQSLARVGELEDLLAQFSSAFEAGSIASLRHSFSASMSGKAALLAEYERVFQRTKQRSIHFTRMRHTAIAADRLLSSGHATVATVGMDDRLSRQRVYLEIEIALEAAGPRISRIANYEQ